MSLASLPSRVSVTAPLGLPEVAADPLNVGIVWDAENHLVEVKQGAATLASYTYDGLGRRQQKIVGGVTHTYISDGDSLVEERTSTSQTLRYVEGPGIDRHLAMRDDAAVTYYLADHLGSVVHATNGVGAVTLARKYDPWGNMLAGASAAGWSFTGREWDPETALAYYRARYYDPKLGRFTAEDPIGFDAGVNFYAYVANQPTRFGDPTGLFTEDNVPPQNDLCRKYGNCGPRPPTRPWIDEQCARKVAAQIIPSFGPADSDKYKHCVVSCYIDTSCNRATAVAAGIGKEIQDMSGSGNPEWADWKADWEGIKCGERSKKNRPKTCERFCRQKYP